MPRMVLETLLPLFQTANRCALCRVVDGRVVSRSGEPCQACTGGRRSVYVSRRFIRPSGRKSALSSTRSYVLAPRTLGDGRFEVIRHLTASPGTASSEVLPGFRFIWQPYLAIAAGFAEKIEVIRRTAGNGHLAKQAAPGGHARYTHGARLSEAEAIDDRCRGILLRQAYTLLLLCSL